MTDRPTANTDAGVGEAPVLDIVGLTHTYGDVVALDDVTVSAKAGEFLTILGESGSGKTTLLRMISGLEAPGRCVALRLGGVDVREVPAYRRDCTTVFQNYALFPHMTVGENVEYGLKMRGVPPTERRQRALDAFRLVRLDGLHDRRVNQLSGGQRQRVALARALVPRPTLLLLDEPLGALDEKLRVDMQVELMSLHKQLGMTFVYITHSQEEALTMSDRIVLMRKGRIAQAGSPHELFDAPVDSFVSRFMGVENCLDGTLVGFEGASATVQVGDRRLEGKWTGGERPAAGTQVAVAVRAEAVRFSDSPPEAGEANVLACQAGEGIYKGKYLDRTATTPLGTIKARIWDTSSMCDQPTVAWWRKESCVVTRH